jgi:GTP-binding protein LepA
MKYHYSKSSAASFAAAAVLSREDLVANSLQAAELAALKQSSLGQELLTNSSGLARASAKDNASVFDLNLIDTPGHVDFSYEVSRSLQACEGAVLVVDASQGIQAQTLANVYLALEQDLTIIPVLNKVDLPAADVPRVSKEVINLLGCDESDIIKISAKTGENVEQVLSAIVEHIPLPSGESDQPTRALIFDSY